jgi:hypothetical protein
MTYDRPLSIVGLKMVVNDRYKPFGGFGAREI